MAYMTKEGPWRCWCLETRAKQNARKETRLDSHSLRCQTIEGKFSWNLDPVASLRYGNSQKRILFCVVCQKSSGQNTTEKSLMCSAFASHRPREPVFRKCVSQIHNYKAMDSPRKTHMCMCMHTPTYRHTHKHMPIGTHTISLALSQKTLHEFLESSLNLKAVWLKLYTSFWKIQLKVKSGYKTP